MTATEQPEGQAVAVVGMACRYPGAGDVEEFWGALRAGLEGIRRFDPEELLARGADPELVRGADFVPAKGVIAGAHDFDWSFFGYSRAEAAGIDPQQRVFLECASTALDDAGIDPTRFPGWIGVYAGADVVPARGGDAASELAGVIGREKDFLATRVAYKLGLRGPALTVQTACSTSLTATHLAVRGLLGYECDAALAGGVAVIPRTEWGYRYEAGGILSPDGHCRPFDARAAGTVPSEGVGVVVLRRLADALRDGDRIAAVILASAVNNDGGDKVGYTAPSVRGQSDVIRFAQHVGGIDPLDIDYVEAHGTATRIGDPVEVRALADVFQASTRATGWCRLGAVKSNLGHTGAAAGAAGLIKTVLMLEHGELVPSLHYDTPNPLLELDSSPFRVCTRSEPWPDRGTRLAAVSSFGVGGTNAHAILAGPPRRTGSVPRPGPRVVAVSAVSAGSLEHAAGLLADRLAAAPGGGLPAVARTLAGRRAFGHRRAVVATDPAQAAALLRRDPASPGSAEAARTGGLDRVAFLFPGQGTLRSAAGAAAYRLLGGFRVAFDEIRDTVRDTADVDLSPVVTGTCEPDWFADTVHQQLGLLALGYALGRQLEGWGIRPEAMLGNSIGEYAAATLAGVWSPAEAAALVSERARAMWATAPGAMVSVAAGRDEVSHRLAPGSDVTVAIVGPDDVVLSGPRSTVDDLLTSDALHGLAVSRLSTRRAFHSAAMEHAAPALASALASVDGRPARIRLVSNETGDWADPDAVARPDYWVRQLRRPVRLDRGAGTLLASGCDTYLELGPGASMLGTLRRHPAWNHGHAAIPLLGRREDPETGLQRAIAALWERGAAGALDDLHAGDPAVRCSLPAHPLASADPQAGAQERPAPEPSTPARTSPAAPRPVSTLEELWCSALGVPSVADSDDFFALGGESLLAVTLTNRIRRATGVTVPIDRLTANPTFGNLRRLVDPDGTLDARPAPAAPDPAPTGVVALRDGGSLPPLFLAADATGSTLGYRHLADLLDGRPVYGLEPAADLPRRSLEDIAAGHVDALRSIRPAGPYTLVGWSFGAVVAHEMARRLTDAGERVDLLVCLDGTVRAGGLDVGYLAGRLRLQAGAALGIGLLGRRVRRTPEVRRTVVASLGALGRYRPRPVACRTVLFTAGGSLAGAERLRRRLAPLYPGGLRVHPAGGDHWSMLAPPHVRSLATRLRDALPDAATAVAGKDVTEHGH